MNNYVIMCRWNSEKLLEKYYEDPDKVIRDAGVTLNATPTAKSGIRSSANSAKAKVVDCMICGDPLTNSNSCALECNHEYGFIYFFFPSFLSTTLSLPLSFFFVFVLVLVLVLVFLFLSFSVSILSPFPPSLCYFSLAVGFVKIVWLAI